MHSSGYADLKCLSVSFSVNSSSCQCHLPVFPTISRKIKYVALSSSHRRRFEAGSA